MPFHPPQRYPELPGLEVDPANRLYAEVRQTLIQLGLDRDHVGTQRWNPLRDIVKPGMTVLIKPNTVSHKHWGDGDVFSLITHASVVRPLLDYVCLALEGKGRILLGDSQFLFSRFDEAMQVSQIADLLDWFRGQTSIPVDCLDFRRQRAVATWRGKLWGRCDVNEDPKGYVWVNLGDESHFRDVDHRKLRISVSDPRAMRRHHSPQRHEYLLPQSVLDSDVIIHVPKMKTHRRGAVSLGIKSFIGLPADKDSLPHYTIGAPSEGGDQYINASWRKRLCTWLHDRFLMTSFWPVQVVFAALRSCVWATHRVVPFRDTVNEAMWPGNDTLWRTLLDLVRIVCYADRNGRLQKTLQRRQFFLVDGIIAGQGNGPLEPTTLAAGALVAGHDPVAVDAVTASWMGFDPEKIPIIRHGLLDDSLPRPLFTGTTSKLVIYTEDGVSNLSDFQRDWNLRFDPHPNWIGHVERPETA